jgi:hypothetical protein
MYWFCSIKQLMAGKLRERYKKKNMEDSRIVRT